MKLGRVAVAASSARYFLLTCADGVCACIQSRHTTVLAVSVVMTMCGRCYSLCVLCDVPCGVQTILSTLHRLGEPAPCRLDDLRDCLFLLADRCAPAGAQPPAREQR